MARILLFGQARFGLRVLEGLLERGHEVAAVVVPPRCQKHPADPLQEAAEQAGLRLLQRVSYKTQEAFDILRPDRVDLGLLAYVTQIIPLPILDAPRLASVCFHPSLLPAYRGGSAVNWQIIRGEQRGGFTLFRPNAGIDAGPIYLQRDCEIGSDDSAGSYYYGTIFEPGVAATLEAVELLLEGKARATVQDERLASYDPLCRHEHAAIDWKRPTKELHNLIRGCDPAPGAHSMWRDKPVFLYGSARRESTKAAKPGTVLACGEGGIEIATADGSLLLARMRWEGPKMPAEEAATSEGLKPGDRLG